MAGGVAYQHIKRRSVGVWQQRVAYAGSGVKSVAYLYGILAKSGAVA